MQSWEKPPTLEQFVEGYYRELSPYVDDLFDDEDVFGSDLYSLVGRMNWREYRKGVLTLDPELEEKRLLHHVKQVEDLFNFNLEGEAILFASLHCMDGYARFDRGTHRVFLGVDESHAKDHYLDILQTHELTHVARESRRSVWEGFGLNPEMTHDEFTENQPVIEHLMGEGFSCYVSELLVPCEEPWHYAYQSKESLARVYKNAKRVDQAIHQEILLAGNGDYGRLYNPRLYGPGMPPYTQYVWGWQWTKKLTQDLAGGNPRLLVERSSKEFIEHALSFRLADL